MRFRFPFLRRASQHNDSQQRPRLWMRLLRIAFYVLATVVIADTLYLAAIWPDWEALSSGPIPKSKFIYRYEELRAEDNKLPPLRWQPVSLAHIASIMGRAAIAAE